MALKLSAYASITEMSALYMSVATLQILRITNRRRAFLSSIHLAIYLKVGIKYEKNVLDILKVAYQ